MGSPRVWVRTLRGRRGPGSRVAPLTPPTPRPFPPVPGLPLPLRKLSLFPPHLRPTPPARGSVQGIGGGGEAAEKGDDPFLGGVEFQLPTLGPNGTPLPGPSCPHLLPGDRAADRRVVCCARSGELGSARHAPALPPPAPRLSLPPFH